MAPYHGILAHFPIALLSISFLIILYRTFSTGQFAEKLDGILTPLLFLGVVTAALAFIAGLFVWPWGATYTSPLARNHLLLAGWALAAWGALWLIRWRIGATIWQGGQRFAFLILALAAIDCLTIAGTLGGSLAGNPSGLPRLLEKMGWDVHTTFYLPDGLLIGFVIASIAIVILATMHINQPLIRKKRGREAVRHDCRIAWIA